MRKMMVVVIGVILLTAGCASTSRFQKIETRLNRIEGRLTLDEKVIKSHEVKISWLRATINKIRPRLGEIEDKTAFAAPQIYALWTASFSTDSSTLPEKVKEQLDVLIEALKKEGVSIKKIVGYADVRGKSGYNQSLALRRAESVKIYLKNKGLDLTGVLTVSGGETSRFGGYKNNRRVAIIGCRNPAALATTK